MEEDGFKGEVVKSKRDAPPAHYGFKIESFSQLLEFLSRTGSEKFESREFEVAGYKWKLSLYPKGDTKRNGSGHISLYLVLSETNNLPFGTEVNAFFRLFAYDQIQDKYLMVQDATNKQTRFHAVKSEGGIAKFIPLVTFNDPSSGYLVDDCCTFGAEVFLTNSTGKGEIVSIKRPQKTITHTLGNFSKLEDKEYKSSPVDIAGYQWCLLVYPNRFSTSKGKHISVYLFLDFSLSPQEQVWADFKLIVKNQVKGQDVEHKLHYWFSASKKTWGKPDLLLLTSLKDETMGYILKDTVTVEVEVTQVVACKDFPSPSIK